MTEGEDQENSPRPPLALGSEEENEGESRNVPQTLSETVQANSREARARTRELQTIKNDLQAMMAEML